MSKKNPKAVQPKVAAATGGAGVAGAVSLILVWVLEQFGVGGTEGIPVYVGSAFTTVIAAAGAFAGGYFKRG